ncbi:hypothetical protein LTR84_006840 [Exophiala bonariae]|uniref:Uncharacterized protein n=1 Tax=Exophiala bonariae TaxID=1690606 RepID=A0AAV9N021_9EURO|nr:hypothetical protein LTR84_006840 [Exophiala bonariae]
MTPRTIYRGQLGSASLVKTPIYLRTSIERTARIHAAQVRMLWWWNRQPSDWQSSFDEHTEERLRRHQKIMRYKYSKALRRRAMWERDDIQPWSWKSARWQINQHCHHTPVSTTTSSQPPANKEKEDSHAPRSETSRFHAFRSYVDQEIARDPYGLLFGKRLESPPSTNNSSWTSFSWIFQPKEQTTAQGSGQHSQQPLSSNPASPPKQPSPQSKEPSISSSEPTRNSIAATEEEYEYDPITMRKVLKIKDNVEPAPEQPFLKSLFAEHGVDIPVKTYKPHRVFGYGSDAASNVGPRVEATSDKNSHFGSSRRAELASLIAQSKGNNIDTTAQFTDIPAQPEVESTTSKPDARPQAHESPEPDDTTPLFSGTTYEARSPSSNSRAPSLSDWLSREGFRPAEISSLKEKTLEPALDRMVSAGAGGTTNSSSTAVESTIVQDAAGAVKANQGLSKRARNNDMSQTTSEEDIDLLRASDIRAATKSARISKQQLQSSKQRTRSKLETNFTAHQVVQDQIQNIAAKNIPKTAGQISKSLTNIWKHVKDYPSGIVARTMQSMTSFNDDYKKYVRPSNTSHLTEKLVFKDKDLSTTPSIYKATTVPSVKLSSPSSDFEKEIAKRFDRMERLKAANKEAEDANKKVDAQLSQLAVELNAIYEEAYPSTSEQLTHSQSEPEAPKQKQGEVQDNSKTKTVEATRLEKDMQEPRPEVQSIETGLQVMNPAHEQSSKLKVVMDGTKELRRELHETGMAIRAIESGRPQTVWNTPSPISTNFGKKRMELTDRRREPTKVDQQNVQPTVSTKSHGRPSEPDVSTVAKEVVPKEVPPPVFTPSESPIWNDEQPPPIESLREQPLQSLYAILVKDGKRIVLSPSDTIPASSDPPSSATLILSKLRYAAHYLQYFERLDKDGYDLYSGARNMLIFQRRGVASTAETSSPPVASTDISSTPPTSGSVNLPKEIATVVEGMPKDVESSSDTAATHPLKKLGELSSKSTVRRQEEVFSGTRRPGQAAPRENEDEGRFAGNENKDGIWKRLTRTVRRAVLTIVALGGAAYTVGFIAEGIGAQAQIQKGTDDGHVQGPRKRVVMNGQRAGIYSTESSR